MPNFWRRCADASPTVRSIGKRNGAGRDNQQRSGRTEVVSSAGIRLRSAVGRQFPATSQKQRQQHLQNTRILRSASGDSWCFRRRLNLPSYFLSRDAVDFANAFVSLLSQGEDHMTKKWIYLLCALILGAAPAFTDNNRPKPLGKMVDLGGHRLHVNCTGKGRPTVVVENGLGDFSFDWILVQSRVSEFTRICAYDRAGYAWSDPGPKPRTFAQINLELRDALSKLGENRKSVV